MRYGFHYTGYITPGRELNRFERCMNSAKRRKLSAKNPPTADTPDWSKGARFTYSLNTGMFLGWASVVWYEANPLTDEHRDRIGFDFDVETGQYLGFVLNGQKQEPNVVTKALSNSVSYPKKVLREIRPVPNELRFQDTPVLWWEKERLQQREAMDRVVALRNEVRRICGQQGNLVDNNPRFAEIDLLQESFEKKAAGILHKHFSTQELPEGLFQLRGKLWATCRSCGNSYHWDQDPSEFSEQMSYCNGSPHCVP